MHSMYDVLNLGHHRIQSLALEALQEASEVFVTGVLERAYLCSIHAHRVTVMVPDMKLVRRIGDLNI